VGWYSFTVAFKGVFLEGLEVAFIVLTFGTARTHGVALAAPAAALALLVVVVAGVLAHAPLSRVPENALKFIVGLLLTTFGTFWSAEVPARRGRATTQRCPRSSLSSHSPRSLRRSRAARPSRRADRSAA
jgi:hypothetical protein